MHTHIRRICALLFALCLLTMPTYATESLPPDACPHHLEHDEFCGYSAAISASACSHIHNAECFVQACLHSGHDDFCGFREEVLALPCAHDHDDSCYRTTVTCAHIDHTEACGYAEDGECRHECSEELGCTTERSLACLHLHDTACGYAAATPAVACAHTCTEETGCLTIVCLHKHDELCGFTEAVDGTPCGFICQECAQPTPTPEPDETATPEPSEAATPEPAPTDEPPAAQSEEPTYLITFPASLVLDVDGGITQIEASGVMNLAEGEAICVTAHSANGFELRGENDAVAYTLSIGGEAIANGGVVAQFAADGTQQLEFAVTGVPRAGLYTDTLTFTVCLMGGETTE